MGDVIRRWRKNALSLAKQQNAKVRANMDEIYIVILDKIIFIFVWIFQTTLN